MKVSEPPAAPGGAWDAVRAAVLKEDAAATAAVVNRLTHEERRQVARALPGLLAELRSVGHGRAVARSIWSADECMGWAEAMRIAGAGTIAGAAAVAAWLNRRDFRRFWQEPDDVPYILQVVAGRPEEWRADLAVRLALRLRGTDDDSPRSVRLALELLRRTGTEPPAHDPFTLAWIAAWPADPGDAPLLDAMLPRVFAAEGAGRLLRGDEERPVRLAALAASGRVSRALLLNGCVSRFLRGGAAADLRFFVRLHEALAPSAAEVAGRRRDYAALLPAAPANVADLALKRLRALGGLEPEEAREAVEGLLFRAEGKLVRAGLIWLDRLLRDHPGDLDGYAPALATALMCETGEARERAARLVLKHAARFTPDGAAPILDAVALMPPGEGAALAEAFGGDPVPAAPENRFTPPPLPPVPRPAPMPAPVAMPAELLRLWPFRGDWLPAERWLDGFVRLAASDRPALTEALAAVAGRFRTREYWRRPWRDPEPWILAMAKELCDPGVERRTANAVLAGDRPATVGERIPEAEHTTLSIRMPLRRYAEVYQALTDGALPPYLLATPTHVSGRLDAAALVERLEGYERDGVEPLPVDLEQALLRLSRTASGEVAARAARLTGAAGRAVARLLSGERAEPRVGLRWEESPHGPRIMPVLSWDGTGITVLEGELPAARSKEVLGRLLPVLAAHRDVAAALTVDTLRYRAPYSTPGLDVLAALATAEGPAGTGVAFVAAESLCFYPEEAVPHLLELAASGGLGEETGRQLAVVLRDDATQGKDRRYRPAEVLRALEELARRGAHREVWGVMAGLLAAYLPGPGERATSTHTRMTALAADVAWWANARGALEPVAELAGRGRVTGLVREARRLHAVLTA
ncbi:DUF6493 family protein [Nonomuraea roseoviolacea]|uniref:DUF7824 domain-containing protein n=1 Tax=Nonomuraea roseoviolacea subsp. carminata TaxID=160689 RepID=A0ABT1K2S2_9ACTN|nr:DUF6493 family protein [Nonomuraea roseoviolacea]MCP2348296.1 hypothetical protein [Nonomuraea roseoviolacea subsp. carminata]